MQILFNYLCNKIKNIFFNYKIVFLFIVILIFLIISFFKIINSDNSFINKSQKSFKNIVLIGWDGVQRDHLYESLEAEQLPNLNALIADGKIVDINISTGETETKPGWAEILTGYSPKIMKVHSNRDYEPIPEGYTLFERLKELFGDNGIKTIFLSGKINNLAARGPHSICTNCLTRDPLTREKTDWWDENTTAPIKDGSESRIFETRKGEPYFSAKNSFNLFQVGLGDASKVGYKAIEALEKYKDQRFIALFHFEEPDESGHIYGENSEEYSGGLITDDNWLGIIINKLKELDIFNQTLVYVVSDHGFDEGKNTHKNAPYTFMATNDKSITKKIGDRKDIAPTILQNYKININQIKPPLEGESLKVK